MKMTLELEHRSYDLIVKRGSLGRVGQLFRLDRKVLVVTDEGVPEAYLRAVLAQCGAGHPLVLPQGEAGKTIDGWRSILERLYALDFGRDDLLIGLGGGLVGDMTGFAAACYLRALPYLLLPTTTLSQADSSVGGMVSVNLGEMRNGVGVHYQPRLVLADPDTLDTLPARHWANGLAEALKAALLGSRELFELMENEDIKENIERVLYLAIRYKKGVVERDEAGRGERRLLNFGYTLGRGIELAGAGTPKELLHGESIALGMLPMIESRTLARRTRAVMKKLGLPLRLPFTKAQVLRYVEQEKTRNGDRFDIVRVKRPGDGYLERVDYDEVRMLFTGEE